MPEAMKTLKSSNLESEDAADHLGVWAPNTRSLSRGRAHGDLVCSIARQGSALIITGMERRLADLLKTRPFGRACSLPSTGSRAARLSRETGVMERFRKRGYSSVSPTKEQQINCLCTADKQLQTARMQTRVLSRSIAGWRGGRGRRWEDKIESKGPEKKRDNSVFFRTKISNDSEQKEKKRQPLAACGRSKEPTPQKRPSSLPPGARRPLAALQRAHSSCRSDRWLNLISI